MGAGYNQAEDLSMSRILERDAVISQLRAALPGILEGQMAIMLAYLYGSVAEGCPLPDSDIDVALVLRLGHGLSPYQRMLLELDIGAEIEAACGWPEMQLDVRSINDAPITAQGTVVTEGVCVYSRDEDFRVDWETSTRKRYFDFEPVARMMQRAYFEHMAEELRRKGLLDDDQP